MTKVLLVGESWVSVSTHYKGFNHFVSGTYETGLKWFNEAMDRHGVEVNHMPAHEAANDFPFDSGELTQYDCIILSDIGADSFLLHPKTWLHGERTPNRLNTIKEYVEKGGGLIMAGGYMSFQGINGAAMYQRTPVAEALPVLMMATDDRCERPEGVEPKKVMDHPIVEGLPETWPHLLGYNLVTAKPDADVVARVGEDALVVAGSYGKGRCVAITTDIGPHWCPAEFAEWEGYGVLWRNMIKWASGMR
ncbi:MAG: glutamine amidotransferase [Candidatus Bathyarchaeota archaeon]|nr:glutamine amidotransferase [Candidatus Bathyarchaeota archaeon]